MKAAVYDEAGTPDVLQYRDVADPKIGPGDVLIATTAISIEGGDLINRRSNPPAYSSWIVGYAASGRVVEVGANVRNRKVGDEVTAFNMQGSHAELWGYLQTTHGSCQQTWMQLLLQSCLSRLVPLTIAFCQRQPSFGETVLIQGAAGGVGLAAVQLAARTGARVIAVSSGERRLEKISSLGADYVIDRSSGDVVDAVQQITEGKGVDTVIDPVGATLAISLATMAHEGRLVFVGNAGGGGLSWISGPPCNRTRPYTACSWGRFSNDIRSVQQLTTC